MPATFRQELATDEIGGSGDLFDLEPPAWHQDAACKEAPPSVTWFPEHGQKGLAAKRVCQRCLSLSECRSWALEQGPELAGIWGGLDEKERRAIRREQKRAA